MFEFLKRFKFDPEYAGYIGAEEELWTVDKSGKLISASVKLFHHIRDDGFFKPELPSQQIEAVTDKCESVQALAKNIVNNRNALHRLGKTQGFRIVSQSMPPSDFELKVYPKERYLDIAEKIPPEVLRNAWIAGLHIHIGCSSANSAIFFLNCFRSDLPALLALSAPPIVEDVASERFFNYLEMCPEPVPPHIKSFAHLAQIARKNGFYEDPRKCWWFIRINPHGTFEIRVFEAQKTAREVGDLASLVMRRYLLYRDGIIKPRRKKTDDILEELKQAAEEGLGYEETEDWVDETVSLSDKKLPLCKQLYKVF